MTISTNETRQISGFPETGLMEFLAILETCKNARCNIHPSLNSRAANIANADEDAAQVLSEQRLEDRIRN
jgi:hypothetical protein